LGYALFVKGKKEKGKGERKRRGKEVDVRGEFPFIREAIGKGRGHLKTERRTDANQSSSLVTR
jgi:hypothetical protein